MLWITQKGCAVSANEDAHPGKKVQCRSREQTTGFKKVWQQEHCNEGCRYKRTIIFFEVLTYLTHIHKDLQRCTVQWFLCSNANLYASAALQEKCFYLCYIIVRWCAIVFVFRFNVYLIMCVVVMVKSVLTLTYMLTNVQYATIIVLSLFQLLINVWSMEIKVIFIWSVH